MVRPAAVRVGPHDREGQRRSRIGAQLQDKNLR